MKRKNGKNQVCVYRKEKSDFSQQIVAIFYYLIIECRGILNEGIMEEQNDKKIMMIVSICALVCGGVYYFLYNSNIKENKN